MTGLLLHYDDLLLSFTFYRSRFLNSNPASRNFSQKFYPLYFCFKLLLFRKLIVLIALTVLTALLKSKAKYVRIIATAEWTVSY